MAGGKMSGKDLGLLVLRLGLGGIMILHGVAKLRAEGGVNAFADLLANLGLGGPSPQAMAIAVLAAEIGGGALVVLGLMAQLGALAIAAVMVGAIVKVHWPNGFFLKLEAAQPGPIPHGYEYCVALLAMALCILFAGPGALALRIRKGGGKPPG
jgi:putative oxidoreductase